MSTTAQYGRYSCQNIISSLCQSQTGSVELPGTITAKLSDCSVPQKTFACKRGLDSELMHCRPIGTRQQYADHR